MSIPDDPRTTKGITHEQRYHLCLKKQECPSMKQSELASWFKEKYNFSISQPTISHSLKRSAEILSGGLFTPGIEATRVRKRPVRHPELEQAIYQWVKSQQQLQGQQRQQRERDLLFQCSNGGDGTDELRGYTKSFENAEPVTGPILLQQARRIASEMGIKDTVFCPGWLSRFKARYGLKSLSRTSSANVPVVITANSSTSANTSSPSSPISDQSLPAMTLTSGTSTNSEEIIRSTQNNNVISSIEIRPSIAVPASINSTHSSLDQILQQNSHEVLTSSAHTATSNLPNCSPDSSSQLSTSAESTTEQFPSPQTQHKMYHHHQRDTEFLQHYRRHPYHPGSLPSPGAHNFQQQQQQEQQQQQQQQQPSHAPHGSIATQSASTAMHLDFLQSVPIAPSTSGNAFKHTSSSPSSSFSVHPTRIAEPGEPPFATPSPSIVGVNSDNASMDPHSHASSTRNNIMVAATPTFAPQSLQDAQQLLRQLRQYVELHLQDPTIALQSLETLERELDTMSTRESIAILEMTGEHG